MMSRPHVVQLLVAISLFLLVGLPVYVGELLQPYPELRELNQASWDESRYERYFTELAKEKGALYAFDVLRRTELPLGINVHSVAHPIGYVLYDEKGIDGMHDCTQEFRNACSHSIVVEAFVENGPAAFDAVANACAEAPGGQGARAICFHGVGHGILAYLEYDFEEALHQCRTITSTAEEVKRSAAEHRFTDPLRECVGGAVMELMQGSHDPVAWEPMLERYAPPEDPLMPCDAAFMPEDLRSSCYISLTQRYFVAIGAVADVPPPETYPRAMQFCSRAPDAESRAACYGGFGKEFVFYATQQDSGDVTDLSQKALNNIHAWCGYAGDDGAERCRLVALDSLFWAGENGLASSLAFCEAAEARAECFEGLAENIAYFLSGRERSAACDKLPVSSRSLCSGDEL